MPVDGEPPHVLETVAVPACLDEVHALFDELWGDVPDVAPADRMAFETAVSEVAANIVEHAARGQEVNVRLVLQAGIDQVEAHLEDGGHAYDPNGVEGAPQDPQGLPERGWGLAVARSLTDRLVYERNGSVNHWYLARRRSPGT